MTKEELQLIVNDVKAKLITVHREAGKGVALLVSIDRLINDEFAGSLDIDALVIQYLPIYQARLAAIEAAVQAL